MKVHSNFGGKDIGRLGMEPRVLSNLNLFSHSVCPWIRLCRSWIEDLSLLSRPILVFLDGSEHMDHTGVFSNAVCNSASRIVQESASPLLSPLPLASLCVCVHLSSLSVCAHLSSLCVCVHLSFLSVCVHVLWVTDSRDGSQIDH